MSRNRIVYAVLIGLLLLILIICNVRGCETRKSVITMTPRSGDFGQQLAEAIASCLPGACYIDARQITGAQSSADNILLSRSQTTINVAFSSLTLAPGKNIQITGHYVTFEGPAMVTSAIKCQSNNAACVRIGSRDNAGVYGTTLRNLTIIPVSGTYSSAGIEIENGRGPGALLERVSVSDFAQSVALRILEGSWTWTVVDSSFTRSGHGIEFLGDQPNAWVLERNLINSNGHEGVVLRLCDYPSSYGKCTVNSMVFSDGNHFENNAEAGIHIVNGSIYNLDIRDSYAELGKSGTYVLARNDGHLNTQLRISGMVVDGGGGWVSDSAATLNLLDGTKGYAYGAAPIAIATIKCGGGSCTVTTASPHGLSCSVIRDFSLCPYVHLRGPVEMVTRLTGVASATEFTFFLNGNRTTTGGTVEYEADLINAIVDNQKWDSSWLAPKVVGTLGTGVTVTATGNSVLDGLGFLASDNAPPGRKAHPTL